MKQYSAHGRDYTEFFAWWPRKMTSGTWVWLDPYYMRPDRNGQGVLLSFDEMLRDYE